MDAGRPVPADVSRETPAAGAWPEWLAPARPGLQAYAALLAGPGVERGLIGPREASRLWDRHLLNCAVVLDPGLALVPHGSSVADVGSGAGLPGLVWAIVRPDLRITLIEPLLRRATFLREAIEELGLDGRVRVRRARAEDLPGSLAQVVTARAVAPLDRLVAWTLPLAQVDGELLALKGRTAVDEIASARRTIEGLGGDPPQVVTCGHGIVDPATTVIRVVRSRIVSATDRAASDGRSSSRRRKRGAN